MIVVLDANVLLRFADSTAAQHPTASAALSALRAQGDSLRTIPQSLYEFWVVATRPIANNGLGLSITEAEHESRPKSLRLNPFGMIASCSCRMRRSQRHRRHPLGERVFTANDPWR